MGDKTDFVRPGHIYCICVFKKCGAKHGLNQSFVLVPHGASNPGRGIYYLVMHRLLVNNWKLVLSATFFQNLYLEAFKDPDDTGFIN